MGSLLDQIPSFLGLGSWTSRMIQPLFSQLRDDSVAPALALLIFAVAVALCCLFLLQSSFIRLQVWRRARIVNRIKDRPAFAASLSTIERQMLKTRYLRH